MNKPLNELTITELAPMLEKKIISPVELTNSVLNQVEKMNGRINAYISVTKEKALEAAKKAEQEIANGNYRGPLHGIPMGIKDNLYFKDEVTTMGSKIHKDFIPDKDATAVKKLRDKGVIFTGKLNLDEYAWTARTTNPHHGTCHNPWDLERITGGSSGGSGAAVAAHMTIATLGTDTGGSVRIPASFCGIFSLKPTFGRVSNFGCFPFSWTCDHIGPMTKNVLDSGYLLEAIAGYDKNDPMSVDKNIESYTSLSGDIKGLRVGINEDFFFDNVDKDVEKLVRQAVLDLEKQGASIVEVDIPSISKSSYTLMATIMPESSAVHHDNLISRSDDYDENVKVSLKVGELFSAVDYIQAQQIRSQLDNEFNEIFKDIDVLITPTLPFLPPKIDEYEVNLNGEIVSYFDHIPRFTGPFNLLGLPVANITCGYVRGLPVGMQIVGPAFGEKRVLNTAYHFEQTHLHLKKDPPFIVTTK